MADFLGVRILRPSQEHTGKAKSYYFHFLEGNEVNLPNTAQRERGRGRIRTQVSESITQCLPTALYCPRL